MKRLLAFFIFAFPVLTIAQEQQSLTFVEFVEIVKRGHPIAKQAQLQTELGEMAILKSKGGADPKLVSQLDQKQFDEKEYYSILDAGLKIPTWYGVSFQAGMEQNRGQFLNPENSTPTDGLYYAGVSLPIGKGLFMDERRAALREAKIFAQATQAQQKAMLNDLLLDAGIAYWGWFRAYANLLVFQDAQQLARQRFVAVKQGASLGDRPAIDTLEAGIQLQTRIVQLRQAELDLKNASAMLSVYLWQDGNVPLELAEETIPIEEDPFAFDDVAMLAQLDTLLTSHPEFVQAQLKLQSLEVEEKYRKEMLKPELNLKYNALSDAYFDSDQIASFNNYTWGFQFSMPLFLRKERGELRMTRVKIQQSERALDQKQAQLNMKVQVAINDWRTLTEIIKVLQRTVSDYAKLLAGERALFQGGESSLFMVNSREMSYIQSQVKLNELISKRFESELKVNHALGVLSTII